MREILFRGKRIDDGKWIEGYYVKALDMYDEEIHVIMDLDAVFYPYGDVTGRNLVDPETICQYTGLNDKNGKKIWEGDIVGYWDTYSTENGLSEADCVGKVVWDDETMSFQVTNRLSAESYEVLDECSVIGNIFDNPELLEV